jgi:hypothetical protein
LVLELGLVACCQPGSPSWPWDDPSVGAEPSEDRHRRGRETLSAEGRRKVRCCWSDREGGHIDEHCCWIGRGEVLACEATSVGDQGCCGHWQAGEVSWDRWRVTEDEERRRDLWASESGDHACLGAELDGVVHCGA